jgi:hypothetical protein
LHIFETGLDIEPLFTDGRVGYVGAWVKERGLFGDIGTTKRNRLEVARNTKSLEGIVCRTQNTEDWVKRSVLGNNANVPDLCQFFGLPREGHGMAVGETVGIRAFSETRAGCRVRCPTCQRLLRLDVVGSCGVV